MPLLLTALLLLAASPEAPRVELVDFGAESLPEWVVTHHAAMERVPHGDGHARRIDFERVDWPNVFFHAPGGAWDWSDYAGVAVTLHNPGDAPVDVAVRVDNPGADGLHHSNTSSGSAPPGETYVLRCRFNTGAGGRLWGMRGLPVLGPAGSGPVLNTANIVAFQVFLPQPARPESLLIESAWLFGRGGDIEELVEMPFVDRFGQYLHGDWPGKLKDEAEWAARREAERLAAAAPFPGRDAYGGWADGPKREATGWFRTEKVDGKWWLVTPDGRLFFSAGIDCVGTWEQTFMERRESWFAWLPEEGSPFAEFHGRQQNAHSMAEPIGGAGRTFNFYRANLLRKYGEDWPAMWRETSYQLLSAWGFNTIGNWSQGDVLEHSPLPYVVAAGSPPAPPIAGATGYWAKMKDVYAPEFEEKAAAHLAWIARHADNPRCIGFFTDNELAWEGVALGALASPPDQPCRQVLVARLQAQYGNLDALNEAWVSHAESWDALRAPEAPNAAAQADLDEYLHAFARRYFEVMKAALHAHAPHHLYLGCRFSTAPEPAVRACAEIADVVSLNLYRREIPGDAYREFDAPALIGEFHFGALDRGMFHQGLVPVEDQAERASAYRRYVESVARHPNFVGCHWFQYVDEPITGRWYDGENYNIGFVDVTDTPYPELTEAAQDIHARLYPLRAGQNP